MQTKASELDRGLMVGFVGLTKVASCDDDSIEIRFAKPAPANSTLRIEFASRAGCPGIVEPSASDLTAVAQKVIRQHAGHHGLADRNRTNADAGVVAARGADLGIMPLAIHGATRRQD